MLKKEDLYGLMAGGTIIYGTPDDARDYYDELVAKRDSSIIQQGARRVLQTEGLPNLGTLHTMVSTVERTMRELEEEGNFNLNVRFACGDGFIITYDYIMPYETWLTHRYSSILGGGVTNSWQNKIRWFTKYSLGIPLSHGGVRLIYIKLFLEGKITEEDLKLLINSKDTDVTNELMSLVPEGTEGKDIRLTVNNTQEEIGDMYFISDNN